MNRNSFPRCIFFALGGILCLLGFWQSLISGILLLAFFAATAAVLFWQEKLHRKQLQKLNRDLDKLLQQGLPLPIDQYQEGELSILANQMEKITLRLMESANRVQEEKEYLADSLADVSHQLRTPMTAMNLAVTMLRSPELNTPRRMELTAELCNQLSRMDWLVETLLKISKLDAGTIPMGREDILVRELIKKASEPLAIAMDIRSQKLNVCCGAEHFHGDLNWTAEALSNLLKNCMEHTGEGGTISIRAEETPLFTKIEIEDTGEGFATEDLPHLFERFYQGSNAGSNNYGIGLSLARSIITAQNGTIQAKNWEKGAKFIVKFYKQTI